MKSISLIIGFLFLFWSCNNQTNENPNTEEQELGQDCVVFLEQFAAEIEDYVTVISQIEQGESDFNIILKRKIKPLSQFTKKMINISFKIKFKSIKILLLLM